MARIRSEISIHALREEGDTPPVGGRAAAKISIHALREEGDIGQKRYGGVFYISIHALREEGDVLSQGRFLAEESISIHALREEGDVLSALSSRPLYNFYPRPPRGGRRMYQSYSTA